MSPSEETRSRAIQSSHESPARLRIGEIGEVTGVGPCWRLVYDHCDHVQEFAREGLDDPDRLVSCVRRNFPECLTCRLENGHAGKASRPPLDENALATEVMRQPPESYLN